LHKKGEFVLFIYSRFEELRSSKGVTKKFIADKLGRLPAICQDWKYGKSSPNADQLKIIAEILDTTPEYLTGKSDQKEKPVEPDELDIAFGEIWETFSEDQKKATIEFMKMFKK
jgi:transcriptional regulator with XRE-family HTH domain